MKSLKKTVVTFLVSVILLSGGVASTTAFAYSKSVERKLEKIDDEIEQQNKKLNKQIQKRSERNNSSGSSNSSDSSSTKTAKIRDKISELEQDASDIKDKEDKKIAKIVKSIESRKKQSSNRIENLTKEKIIKMEAAKKKHDNDIKTKKAAEANYVAPAFLYNSKSIDKQIADEQEKIRAYNSDIEKSRGTYIKKQDKKNK
jgi:hypothetical protein